MIPQGHINKRYLQESIRSVLHPSSLRRRLVHGAFWSTVAALVSQLTAMAVGIIAARMLGNGQFGQLGMVRSTILIFSVLTGTSLGTSCTKYVAEFRSTAPERAGRIIGLILNVGLIVGTFGTLLCFVLASPLAVFVINAEQLADTLRIGCLLVGLNILIGAEIGSLNGLEAFQAATLIRSLLGVLSLIFVPVGVWKYGVNGAVGGYVAATLCTMLVGHIMLKHQCRRAGIAVTHRHVMDEAPVLWKFAIPAVLAGISTQLFEWLARVLLAHQPDGFEQVGIITAALSMAMLVQFLPQQVAVPLMPVLSNIHSAGKCDSFRNTIRKSSLLLIAVGLSVAVPIAIFARYLMAMYGASFTGGGPVLIVLALTYGLASVTMISTTALASTGRMWTQMSHKLAWGITMVVSMHMLVGYGALGMACSYAIANLVYGTLQFVTVARLVHNVKNERQSNTLSQADELQTVTQPCNF